LDKLTIGTKHVKSKGSKTLQHVMKFKYPRDLFTGDRGQNNELDIRMGMSKRSIK